MVTDCTITASPACSTWTSTRPWRASYELYFASARLLNLGSNELDEAYRRMVFNVVCRNQDDHPKNLGFLMTPEGRWSLAPAFDLTWAHGGGYTAQHQMSVNGKAADIDRGDLLTVGEEQGIKRAPDIIDQVVDAARQWPQFAKKANLPAEWIERVQRDLLVDACSERNDHLDAMQP